MRYNTKFLFIFLFLQLFSTTSTALTFAYIDKHNPPYQIGNGTEISLSMSGISIEALLLLEKKSPNTKVEFIRMPWARCLAELKKGTVDGIWGH